MAELLVPVPPSSDILNQISTEYTLDELALPETQAFIDGMFAFANGEQGDSKRPTLVGLAAPQMGVLKKVIIIDINADGSGKTTPNLVEFVNPELSEISIETELDREGCYSTDRACGAVERARSLVINGLTRYGKRRPPMYLVGFKARVAQHENDHLHGIRFPDRITNPDHLHWVPVDQFGDYREQWRTWKLLCSREKWLAIKTGRAA